MSSNEKEKKIIITHSGSFHPDDVFAVATLLLYLEVLKSDVQIIRTRNPEIMKTGDFVVDVGGISDEVSDKFDHHQEGGAGDRRGIPYAAFGLVWKKYGTSVAGSSDVAAFIDQKLVQFIDAMDNGVGELHPVVGNAYPYSIGHAISNFNPSWKEAPPDYDRRFGEVLDFALPVLRREIDAVATELEGRRFVEEAYAQAADKRLIILDKNYSWNSILSHYREPLYVIHPSYGDGEIRYGIEAVRDNDHSFVNRKDMPKAWGGKRDKELAAITGVPDAVFCHTKLFFAVAESKEGAIALAKRAIEA